MLLPGTRLPTGRTSITESPARGLPLALCCTTTKPSASSSRCTSLAGLPRYACGSTTIVGDVVAGATVAGATVVGAAVADAAVASEAVADAAVASGAGTTDAAETIVGSAVVTAEAGLPVEASSVARVEANNVVDWLRCENAIRRTLTKTAANTTPSTALRRCE